MEALAPPSACLTEVSSVSFISVGSLPVASLKAAGEEAANLRTSVMVCVCKGKGGACSGFKSIVITGSKIPRRRGSTDTNH